MTLNDIRKKLKAAAAEGELLAAIDYAQAGAALATDPDDVAQMRIDEVILLARAASHAEATDKYRAYGLGALTQSAAKSLRARLEKDLGFAASGAARTTHLATSRDLYRQVCDALDPDWDRTDYEYNAINVITLSALIGQTDQAADLIARLSAFTPQPTYYSWATRAELLLATDRPAAEVAAALRQAIACDDDKAGADARITTLTQLDRISPGHPALDLLKPGPFLHYTGHMIAAPGETAGRILADHADELAARIAAALDAIAPSAVFGSLASGADILIVETALAMGAQAQIFLPFDDADFHRSSIAPAGADWAIRARACLAHPQARRIDMTRGGAIPDQGESFAVCSRRAMGAAILTAQRRRGDARQLVVWDGEATTGVAGTDADRRMWASAVGDGPDRQIIINVGDLSGAPKPHAPTPEPPETRRMAALVFGDAKNFSKLGEDQLPLFVDRVLGGMARALAPAGSSRLFSNTWGDGVFAVFDSAAAAAEFALRLQDEMQALREEMEAADYAGPTLPAALKVRLGMHFGAVFEKTEPVTGVRNYFGEAVARAARIEPITVEGRVFVSEEFAAELALDPATNITADYVGEKEAAKNYGKFRLYRIRR